MVESKPEMAESETVIAEEDIPFLLENLNDYTFKWREIGIALGFSLPEINTIDEDLKGRTSIIHLAALLNRWWQWPNENHKEKPTLERLCKALDGTLGLGALSRKLLSRRNDLPSLQPKKQPTRKPISSEKPRMIRLWLIQMCKFLSHYWNRHRCHVLFFALCILLPILLSLFFAGSWKVKSQKRIVTMASFHQ